MNTENVKEAIQEIRNLRAENTFMRGRLQMFDDMLLLLRSRLDYGTGQGMSEDICWKLEKEMEKPVKEMPRNEKAKPSFSSFSHSENDDD